MKARFAETLQKLLWGRAARNVYFWAANLYVAFGLNAGNDRHYHYGITKSPWYLPVMAASLALQCALVYTNNLVLVPRLLARRRRLAYAGLVFALAAVVSLLTVVLLKAARPHLNVEALQNPAFTTTVITPDRSLAAIAGEAPTFLFSNGIWLVLFTMAWYLADYSRQQRALRQAQAQRVAAELAFLKSQINPHFLFNTLNNIYGLALRKSDSTPDVILRLSGMLRYLLYDSDVPDLSFDDEKAAIEAYVAIEALRLPDEAALSLDLYADRDYRIPPLLWMPMLENAFKHGTRLVHAPVSVAFGFRIENGVATIRTTNTFERATAPAGAPSGIGLTNLRKRLGILYPGRYELRHREEGAVAVYELIIRLA